MNRSLSIKMIALSLAMLTLFQSTAMAMCGCMVRMVPPQNQVIASANGGMENRASQVILVRDGNHTVITMANDYKGPVADFAMIVPVPVVLQKEQIRTVDGSIFNRLNSYTAPTLTQSTDVNPCGNDPWGWGDDMDGVRVMSETTSGGRTTAHAAPTTTPVQVLATYQIGGYDMLILSATESTGLIQWLKDKGYYVPQSAAEVLTPYVTSGMKFFVAKVHLDQYTPGQAANLNPIQIEFDSPKFMLPIRLGMANSTGEQDLLIYSFTKNGRIEPVNYRMGRMPTDKKVPEFIAKKFDKFYEDVFTKSWKREGRTSLMLETVMNLSGQYWADGTQHLSYLTLQELQVAGVTWAQPYNPYNPHFFTADQLFLTRIHARYNRTLYPQDLLFQETMNKEAVRTHFRINHPSAGSLDCDQAGGYIEDVIYRRREELNNLAFLAGWDIEPYDAYVLEYVYKYQNVTGHDFVPVPAMPFGDGDGPQGPGASPFTLIFVLGLGLTALWVVRMQRKPKVSPSV
jgi:hypothetical protein